jgi:hypothetical protein
MASDGNYKVTPIQELTQNVTVNNDNVLTGISEGSIGVGISSISVMAADAGRKYALFVNDSNVEIYLSLGGPAVVGDAIRLNRKGGSYEIVQTNLYRGEVFAIAASGTGNNLGFVEGT